MKETIEEKIKSWIAGSDARGLGQNSIKIFEFDGKLRDETLWIQGAIDIYTISL